MFQSMKGTGERSKGENTVKPGSLFPRHYPTGYYRLLAPLFRGLSPLRELYL